MLECNILIYEAITNQEQKIFSMEQIKKATLDFLTALKSNNNRDWFIANKETYLEAKDNFESFVQNIINEIITFEPILKGLEVKNCVYRLNRDIRFSNDKTPYKSHLGAFIVRGGKKNGDRFAGYYFHVEPGASILAGGAYMPPAPWLTAIREKISDEPDEFLEIINSKKFKKHFGNIDGEKLKKTPKGYPSDHPQAALLKYKSYLIMNEVPDKKVLGEDYLEYVVDVFKAMKPFNDYLNEY